jgi:hypothetical protein
MATTLTEKVRWILNDDGPDEDPLDVGSRYPARPQRVLDRPGALTTFESDCLDWGIVYGIAFWDRRVGSRPLRGDRGDR